MTTFDPHPIYSGRLVYVVGPSGAGKDSVIAVARKKLNESKNIYFPPRYVTRVDNNGDDDLPISGTAFMHYRLNGLFALEWEAHGFCYGIGAVINTPLHAGKTVVVNGSRAHIATALTKYPAMTVVQISVTREVARARLNLRARENAEAISARVNRSPQFAAPSAQIITIDNSGVLEHAAQQLMAVLCAGLTVIK